MTGIEVQIDMALTIICITGPSNTGKSTAIRKFTADHLSYKKVVRGDILGVFPMPHRNYAVGVNSYGDNLRVVREGLEFLHRYEGLPVMIVASHTEGATIEEVRRFAKRVRATIHYIGTAKLDGGQKKAATRALSAATNIIVAKIKQLMPPRVVYR